MATHLCSVCGTPTHETRQSIRYDSGSGPVILHEVPVHHCPWCGDHEITLSRAPALRTEVAMCIARKTDRLDPREVRFLREFVGLSRVELADTVGATEALAGAWESLDAPQLMGVQQERLLRVLVITGKRPGQA
ncbi:MAG: YgiT-type zinc finger protein [Archangiaceae bacterium]|nr:YgiT-type zinc finger protein [Archangiaceae bacterium]